MKQKSPRHIIKTQIRFYIYFYSSCVWREIGRRGGVLSLRKHKVITAEIYGKTQFNTVTTPRITGKINDTVNRRELISDHLYFTLLLQVLRDVEMESMGRNSGDSFRSMSSYNQSCRSKSYRKQLERKSSKIRKVEKVRKHAMNIRLVYVLKLLLVVLIILPCMYLYIMHFANDWVCMSFFFSPLPAFI